MQKIKPKREKILLTKSEWVKIRKGSILLSKSGNPRRIIQKNKRYITFLKISDPLKYAVYTWSDICRNYKLTPSKE